MQNCEIAIIGAGFAGMSAAAKLAQAGRNVHVFEKNNAPGGRARMFEDNGFKFDMGPSWYWMPDVFDNFFEQFGKKTSDYYELERLDPSYKVYLEDGPIDIPADFDELCELFESFEKGSAAHLRKFMEEARIKYEISMNDFVHRPCHSPLEFANLTIAKSALKLNIFKSFSTYVRKFFKHPTLLKILEFPVLFLGAKPEKTPALYSIMNYADSMLGTWYPKGGMNEISKGIHQLCVELGVKFHFDSNVEKIECEGQYVTGIQVNGELIKVDSVLGAGDYHHIEQKLLPREYRMYSADYWEKRTMSPSCLLYYVGVNETVPNLEHHNLFFDTDFGVHATSIYDDFEWPDNPLFYVCCPSKTDPTVAPDGKENLFFLIPVAAGLKEESDTREHYLKIILDRLKNHTGVDLEGKIEVFHSYAHKEFISDYNSFKGNAYGLANTLTQTAFLKPKLKNKKLHNLFFAGQLTTPGPGVPPSLISGQIAAEELTVALDKVAMQNH